MSNEKILEKVKVVTEQERQDFGLDEPEVLCWEEVSAARFLLEPPPPREYTFDGLLPSGCVGELTAKGGTGKSFLLNTLCISLATGKNFLPFKPTRKYKTFYLGAEDPEDELHRRIYGIAKELDMCDIEDLTNNLAIYSAMGKIEPIIAFDPNGNPITTRYYDWLRKNLESLGDIEILILDPMSRFYGLRENENSDGTAWIRCLEKLVYDYNLKNLLFAHHISKSSNQNKNLRDSSGRGAYSIRDGCRWTAAMAEMSEEDSKKYEVNPRDYIELDISKANYSPTLPNSVFFKKSEDGILHPVNLRADRLINLAKILVNELADNGARVSRGDLEKSRGPGKNIIKNLKEISVFTGRDITNAINYSLAEGFLFEKEIPSTGGKKKSVLEVGQIPE